MLEHSAIKAGKIRVYVKGKDGGPIRGAWVTIDVDSSRVDSYIKEIGATPADKTNLKKHFNQQKKAHKYTNEKGYCEFDVVQNISYNVTCEAFTILDPQEGMDTANVRNPSVLFEDPISIVIEPQIIGDNNLSKTCTQGMVGRPLNLTAIISKNAIISRDSEQLIERLSWKIIAGKAGQISEDALEMQVTPVEQGPLEFMMTAYSSPHGDEHIAAELDANISVPIVDAPIQPISGDIKTTTSLTRTETSFTEDTAFWTGIRNCTEALSFNTYLSFMDMIFCGKNPNDLAEFESNRFGQKRDKLEKDLLMHRFLPFTDADAYRVMKAATEAFVMVNCGVLEEHALQPFDSVRDNAYLDRRDLPVPQNSLSEVFSNDYLKMVNGNGSVIPYLAVIRRKLPDIPIKKKSFDIDADENCFGLLQEKLANPCLLELIWSYWHEEGMLVQTMNAITRRFQNVHSPSARDPLANMEIDPLRPLNNLLWGYIQDEQHRLTVGRRNYEYDHHYGLRLEGKAVQNFHPVDTRSKFLEAFHHLLRLCTVFYKQDDDTTVKADAFPVLNALKEVHLILSQGAHNQFGDLPSTARIEMLMQQWLLARPEFREFLPTRIMVAYPEPWMDRVDAMKKLHTWDDTSVLHFRNLGMFGEQILLSIRWGHWSDEFEPVKALNWARFFRPQAQGYIHAYCAATGVDLSADPAVNFRVDSTLPSVLLKRRLAEQLRAA